MDMMKVSATGLVSEGPFAYVGAGFPIGGLGNVTHVSVMCPRGAHLRMGAQSMGNEASADSKSAPRLHPELPLAIRRFQR